MMRLRHILGLWQRRFSLRSSRLWCVRLTLQKWALFNELRPLCNRDFTAHRNRCWTRLTSIRSSSARSRRTRTSTRPHCRRRSRTSSVGSRTTPGTSISAKASATPASWARRLGLVRVWLFAAYDALLCIRRPCQLWSVFIGCPQMASSRTLILRSSWRGMQVQHASLSPLDFASLMCTFKHLLPAHSLSLPLGLVASLPCSY